jgi:hypothetical protein
MSHELVMRAPRRRAERGVPAAACYSTGCPMLNPRQWPQARHRLAYESCLARKAVQARRGPEHEPHRRSDMPARQDGANSARRSAERATASVARAQAASSLRQPRAKDGGNSGPLRPQARTEPPFRWRGPCGRATAVPSRHPPWKGCAPAECRFACPPAWSRSPPRLSPRWGHAPDLTIHPASLVPQVGSRRRPPVALTSPHAAAGSPRLALRRGARITSS